MRQTWAIIGVASALLPEPSWPQAAEWIEREIVIGPARVQPRADRVEDDTLARGLFGLANGLPGRWDGDLRGVLNGLVSPRSNRVRSTHTRRPAGGSTPLRSRRVTDAVEDDPIDGLPLNDMARETGRSEYHLVTVSKIDIATTPYSHSMKARSGPGSHPPP